MQDRSSRPHASPTKTCPKTTKRIVALRLRKRLGPVQLAALTGVARSTVHRVLVRCRLNRLGHVDRATGEPVRRYEHAHPGSLLHVDVKKLGNIPDGGGWRFVGRAQGRKNRAATPGQATQQEPQPEDGPRVRAHRPRRPLARRLCRGPRRRDRRDRHGGAAPCGGLVRGARHHHRAGAVGQRFPVRVPPVASDLRRARHPALAHQAATAADQRQDRALPPHPGQRVGLRPLLPSKPNDAPICQHGCTSTTTTDPTPPAGTSHPSAA